MAIKLYGVAASRAFRNIWMLHELGLSYEHDPVHYTDPLLKAAPYFAKNPNARIPIIEVDGFVVYESLAINLYLAEKFSASLSLTTPEERALGTQWALWAMTSIDAPITTWAFNMIVLPEAERNRAAADTALESMQRPLAALNASLLGKEWLIGGRFTVADLNTACCLYRALWMDLSAYPHIESWLKRCLGRPAALVARRERGENI